MQTKVLNSLLLVVFAIGILGAGDLVYSEFKLHNICPKLIGIPACYIILACFIIPLIVHLFKGKNYIYFAFTGLAFIIALTASVMEITGLGECPKTAGGTPMCYYSLLLFSSLIDIKYGLIKRRNKN